MRRSLALAAVVLVAGCSGSPADAPSPSPSTSAQSRETLAPDSAAPSPATLVVPDVVGMDGLAAAAEMVKAGLTSDPRWDGARTVASELFDVVSTEPAAGTPVERGDEVIVNVAAPPVMEHVVEWRNETTVALVVDQTPTARDAHWLVRSIYGTGLDGDMYVVLVNCSSGGTASADNRLANGRLAVGERGAQVSGLQAGQSEVEMVDGATCP